MCLQPPRLLSASASLSSALDILWADRRWRLLHAPLGEVGNLAQAVFLHPNASWFFLDHQQVQLAVVAQLRGATPASAPDRTPGCTPGCTPGSGAAASEAIVGGSRARWQAELTDEAPAGQQEARAASRPSPRSGPAGRGRSTGERVGDLERRRLVVQRLRVQSPPFRRLWSGLRTQYRPRTSYAVHHPDLGSIVLERFVSWTAGTHWHEHVQAAEGDQAAEVLSLLDLL